MRLLTDSEEEGLLDLLVPGFGRLRVLKAFPEIDREAAMEFYIERCGE